MNAEQPPKDGSWYEMPQPLSEPPYDTVFYRRWDLSKHRYEDAYGPAPMIPILSRISPIKIYEPPNRPKKSLGPETE